VSPEEEGHAWRELGGDVGVDSAGTGGGVSLCWGRVRGLSWDYGVISSIGTRPEQATGVA